MIAVFRHELRLYFHSLTAYVFGAFLLAITGIGSMLYNIQAAVSNFEYVLSFGSIVLVVIVPLLTMRSIAEERRQKTDQLLYALPITAPRIVLGKYLALMTVFTIPMAIICIYPLLFSDFGEVYLPTAYAAITAYYFMGAALIAMGVFISSLTDSQGFAAGIGAAAIAVNYFSVPLAEYVSGSAAGSVAALLCLIVALVWILRILTGKSMPALAAGTALTAALAGVVVLKPGVLDDLLPQIMKQLSLFSRFEGFVDGVFDLTSLVFYGTVIVFFLFLTVQSLEKRRYN